MLWLWLPAASLRDLQGLSPGSATAGWTGLGGAALAPGSPRALSLCCPGVQKGTWKGCSCSPGCCIPPAVLVQPQEMLEGTFLTGEREMPTGLCTQGGDMDVQLSNFHPAALGGYQPSKDGLQRKVGTPLVPGCSRQVPWAAYGSSPVPDGNLLPVQLLHAQPARAQPGAHIPAGTAPEPPLGG